MHKRALDRDDDSVVESDSKRQKSSLPSSSRGELAKGEQRTEKKKAGRRRRGTRNDEAGQQKEGLDQPKAPRLPKRQSALLIGFCGSGYQGMQIQPDHTKTIEGVLFQAMVRAGAVSQDNADDPVKIGLARAARTDAGVHAAGNLVSLKMITNVPNVLDITSRINEELPPEIRLWGFVRVQNSFNARLVCDSRKYTYYFPTYLLLPPKPGSNFRRTLQQYNATLTSDVGVATDDSPLTSFWDDPGSLSHDEELSRKRAWRVPHDLVERLRRTARKYEGTHNFHNFTVGREFGDRSSQRHMKRIEVADPVVYGETEWISVLFHGQSFMLHQTPDRQFIQLDLICWRSLKSVGIQRKMMSGLVLTCRTNTPDQIIDELYGSKAIFIPKMPSLGLLLEEPIFDSYNVRMAAINEKLDPSSPDYRPAIDFEAHREVINEFKETYIYNNMRYVEGRYGLFDSWMRTIDSYAGNDFLYLNPKGTIPSAAIIKKGERRESPFKEKKRFDATSFSFKDDEAKAMVDDEEEEEVSMSKKDLAETEG